MSTAPLVGNVHFEGPVVDRTQKFIIVIFSFRARSESTLGNSKNIHQETLKRMGPLDITIAIQV
jgi:hypothetical protein